MKLSDMHKQVWDLTTEEKDHIKKNFMKHVEKTDSCWLWNGYVEYNGYGGFRFRGRCRGAHRVAFCLFKKKPTPGIDVCHTCDVRRCVNPEHLFIGTRSDNMQDARAKKKTTFGEKNPSSKLTEIQVLEIKKSYKFRCPKNNSNALASKFGVSGRTILDIVKGYRWAYIEYGDKE